MKNYKTTKLIIILTFSSLMLFSCGLYKKTDARTSPSQAKDKARQNINEGRGASMGGLFKNRSGGNFEFTSSNPMWRASLEILDFLPLTTVDYSGGIIITDWYNDSENYNDSIKITVRFLSNEIRSDSVKVIVHNKICSSQNKCKVTEQKSKISTELVSSILTKATVLERSSKKNRK
jgi:hypothetical protein